jgi:hypothetical protein
LKIDSLGSWKDERTHWVAIGVIHYTALVKIVPGGFGVFINKVIDKIGAFG